MESLFRYAMENATVRDVASQWKVSSGQAGARLRNLPFVRLVSESVDSHGRGRPPKHVALDSDWSFWDQAGRQPLTKLVDYLKALHSLSEPFALGVPFTSCYWQPFLNPEVRLFASPETFSLWRKFFQGERGSLKVEVGLLPEGANVREIDGLPVLDRPFAAVDAVLDFERTHNVNDLALADWLGHSTADFSPAVPFAKSRGLDRDVAFLKDHRRKRDMRVLTPQAVRRAHELEQELASVPPGTPFAELLERER